MVPNEWIIFFKSTERFLYKLTGFSVHCSALSDLIYVFETLKECFESWRYLSFEICRGESNSVSISLPFHLVLNLVGGRRVDIFKGMASVPVDLLKEVFIEQFEKLMAAAAKQARTERNLAFMDERIQNLAVTLKRVLRSETRPQTYHPEQFPAMRLSDLWLHRFMFPPCMANLVEVLQKKHRLKHHDRVQLTLFLKELGLPLNDALLLWKREYSVPATTSITKDCQPSWPGNERRYIYNIRHLYGLEGGRIDYRAHSCTSIQGRQLSCGEAGGCPFVAADRSTLESFLINSNIDKCNVDHIQKLCNDKQYGYACQSFMSNKLQQRYRDKKDINSNILKGNIKTEVRMNGWCNNQIPKCDHLIKVHHNVINEGENHFTVVRSDLENCDKFFQRKQMNNLVQRSEMKCGHGLRIMKDQANDDLNVQREITHLGRLFPPLLNFDQNEYSGDLMISGDLSSRICEICQQLSPQTVNKCSCSHIDTSNILTERSTPSTSQIDTSNVFTERRTTFTTPSISQIDTSDSLPERSTTFTTPGISQIDTSNGLTEKNTTFITPKTSQIDTSDELNNNTHITVTNSAFNLQLASHSSKHLLQRNHILTTKACINCSIDTHRFLSLSLPHSFDCIVIPRNETTVDSLHLRRDDDDDIHNDKRVIDDLYDCCYYNAMCFTIVEHKRVKRGRKYQRLSSDCAVSMPSSAIHAIIGVDRNGNIDKELEIHKNKRLFIHNNKIKRLGVSDKRKCLKSSISVPVVQSVTNGHLVVCPSGQFIEYKPNILTSKPTKVEPVTELLPKQLLHIVGRNQSSLIDKASGSTRSRSQIRPYLYYLSEVKHNTPFVSNIYIKKSLNKNNVCEERSRNSCSNLCQQDHQIVDVEGQDVTNCGHSQVDIDVTVDVTPSGQRQKDVTNCGHSHADIDVTSEDKTSGQRQKDVTNCGHSHVNIDVTSEDKTSGQRQKDVTNCGHSHADVDVTSEDKTSGQRQDDVTICEHSEVDMNVTYTDKTSGLNKKDTRSQHSYETAYYYLCKCLVNCCNKGTQLRPPGSLISEKKFLVRKPSEIYWFSRKHDEVHDAQNAGSIRKRSV